MVERKIENVTKHTYHPGFLGQGHRAAQIVGRQTFGYTDPFVVLMDDQLDLPGTEVAGGAHPHAGIEIYTYFLKGHLELMTAGSGVVHTEEIKEKVKIRLFQLWVALPAQKRGVAPFLQSIDPDHAPVLKTEDSEIRVYAGSAYGLTSPLQSHTPVTIVDFSLKANTTTQPQLPATYNGFIVVVSGSVFVGGTEVKEGESGWLKPVGQSGDSVFTVKAGPEGVHFVLYSGEPQNDTIIAHGPFVAGTQDEISSLYRRYRNGEMKHIRSHPSRHYTTKLGKTMN